MEHLSGEINVDKISTNIAKEAVFDWSYRSGFHADTNAISLLANPAMRQDASLGKAVKAAATNEKESIEAIMTIINGPTRSYMEGKAIKEAYAKLTKESDFKAIAGTVFGSSASVTESSNWVPKSAKEELLSKWGSIAPDDAAAYIIANPGEIEPKAMRTIIEKWAIRDPHTCVEWAQNLPIGPYFDEAVAALIPHVDQSYPIQARELAQLITDPKIKASSLDRIERMSRARKAN